MTRQRDEQVSKRVDYLEKDDDTRTATGVVMVPWTVDRHGDWERPETIEAFADQFDAFMDAGEADGGIMHAVWPSDWMTLERNEVLDESAEIGGTTVPEGAWVQEWQYNNDQLWALVEDGVLDGRSIGADNVAWEFSAESEDDLPDEVSVPDDVDVEEYWELVDGIVWEVSDVDIPAVPAAQILERSNAKAATEKRLADHLGNRDAFIEEAMERGHSEGDAERLWDVLSTAAEREGASDPGKQSSIASAVKSLVDALRRTGARGASSPPQEDVARDAQTAKDAAGGDSPADADGTDDGDVDAGSDTDSTDMSNDNPENGDGDSDAKELAEQNAAQINELTESVKELTSALKGPEPKTAEIEIEGETYEVPESEVKAAFGVDDDADVADAIKELEDKVDTAHQRIDAVNRQSGGSTQVDAAAAEAQNSDGEGEEGGRLDDIGKALS